MYYSLISIYYRIKFSNRAIILGKGIKIRGKPIINVHKDAKVTIGDDVLLNSVNNGYHVQMYGPVKIMADKAGAVIEIGSKTRIHGSCVHAYKSIKIGNNCLIAANTNIFDADGHSRTLFDTDKRIDTVDNFETAEPVIIEDNVWIGCNSIILPGVRIGEGSIVGAGSVVTKSVPDHCMVAGNPAQIKRRVERPLSPIERENAMKELN